MKAGLYKVDEDPNYPFFKVRGKRALWVGLNELMGNPDHRVNQSSKDYWRLFEDHGEEAYKTHIAPLLMTEWER